MADDGRPDTVVSLRHKLGAPADPEFRIDLPPGWVHSGVSEEDQAKIASRMYDKALQAHRSDIANLVDTMLAESFSAMRKSKGQAVFMPGGLETGRCCLFLHRSWGKRPTSAQFEVKEQHGCTS